MSGCMHTCMCTQNHMDTAGRGARVGEGLSYAAARHSKSAAIQTIVCQLSLGREGGVGNFSNEH